MQKQQDILAIQLQIQQYIDKVLQYNYNIAIPNDDNSNDSSRRSSDNIDQVWYRSTVAAVGTNTSVSQTNTTGHPILVDFEWSDDEDDD